MFCSKKPKLPVLKRVNASSTNRTANRILNRIKSPSLFQFFLALTMENNRNYIAIKQQKFRTHDEN